MPLLNRLIYLLFIALILSACEQEAATPFADVAPTTPTPSPAPQSLPDLRYALAPNMAGLLPDSGLIQTTAQIVPLIDGVNETDLGVNYDIVVQYGTIAGWQQSELMPTLSLVMNPGIPPLGRADLRDILQRSLNAQTVTDTLNINGIIILDDDSIDDALTIRTELANLGLPDGFALSLDTVMMPGVNRFAEQLAQHGIDVSLQSMESTQLHGRFEAQQANAALIVWALDQERQQWVERVGEQNVIDLYRLPISYRAADTVQVSFSSLGFPLISR